MNFGMEVKRIPRMRGVGVFAVASFPKGAAVVRYFGETISIAEGKRRHDTRAEVCVHSSRVPCNNLSLFREEVRWTTGYHFLRPTSVCHRSWLWSTHQPQDQSQQVTSKFGTRESANAHWAGVYSIEGKAGKSANALMHNHLYTVISCRRSGLGSNSFMTTGNEATKQRGKIHG